MSELTIGVYGLWHLGCVTAACLADEHEVFGFDDNKEVIANLRLANSPIAEPGLEALIAKNILDGRLTFEDNLNFHGLDILWITFDTPVDDDDKADVDFVVNRIKACIPLVEDNTIIIISSQLPVGTTRTIQKFIDDTRPGSRIAVAYSPENLRLGKAIDCFKNPDRVIMGIDDKSISRITDMIFDKIEYMSIPAAENKFKQYYRVGYVK